jgi:hypothetical protein
VAVQSIEVGVEEAPAEETPAPEAEGGETPVPTRVDTGDTGLAAEAAGPTLALLATIAGLAVVGGAAGAVSLARARRDA